MSDTKFTAGPWVAFYPHELPKDDVALEVENEYGNQICERITCSDLEEHTANFNLIAAAPKMYNMLEKASEILKQTNGCAEHHTANEIDEVLKEARGEK